MLHFKILIPLLPASFSLRREGRPENYICCLLQASKDLPSTSGKRIQWLLVSPRLLTHLSLIEIQKLNPFVKTWSWGMREQGGRKYRARTERGKANIQENSKKTEKKYLTSREKLEMDLRGKNLKSAFCNLCLILRLKIWNFFLMPLLEEGNATGHKVHTGLCK